VVLSVFQERTKSGQDFGLVVLSTQRAIGTCSCRTAGGTERRIEAAWSRATTQGGSAVTVMPRVAVRFTVLSRPNDCRQLAETSASRASGTVHYAAPTGSHQVNKSRRKRGRSATIAHQHRRHFAPERFLGARGKVGPRRLSLSHSCHAARRRPAGLRATQAAAPGTRSGSRQLLPVPVS
jgi:hypothetical protein